MSGKSILARVVLHHWLTYRVSLGQCVQQGGPTVITRTLTVLGILVLGLMVAAPLAHAITFDLTSCHVTGGCGTQTVFGTVTLTQVGVNVDVVVALAGGDRFVQTGAADQELFKFNGAAGVTNITSAATANPLNAVAGGLHGATGSFNG